MRQSNDVMENKQTDLTGIGDTAYNAAIEFCVFRHNVDSPMSDASLARLFYNHIPAFVKMEEDRKQGIEPPSEGPNSAKSIARYIEKDMEAGREYSDWRGPHLTKETAGLFARGKDNTLNPVFDRLAQVGGYARTDIVAKEAGSFARVDPKKKSHAQALMEAAANNLGMSR